MSKKWRAANRPHPAPVVASVAESLPPAVSVSPLTKPATDGSKSSRLGLWITLLAALMYCIWLGVHWLPLDYTDHELAGSAARVWDVKRELTQHRQISWGTPYFMSGSS